MKVRDLAFTAYAVTDLDRARKFYEGVLGLQPTILKEGMPWVEYAIGPATLGIGVSDKWKPSRDGASIAIEVDNFDEAIAELKNKGVEFEMGPLETPVCHMAVLRDPDGSKICIHRRKDGASYG
jgi:catechol 2,3-dioxygenase-like lactoylglutathione lyase family enzyme